ncbi:hypothetical protein C9J21_18215 [Photobacterium phosphoreum]|uniref:hypothetical protein n=1 Tax=Photobacterium phosphoreum TaxID=659 RepID=UPI000D1717F5|nr:hypothetical protein [Photobacterium phosphoreum]PSW30823.1 hypothetical protein C9J21_18215 [Photobacterium phosphoreum]
MPNSLCCTSEFVIPNNANFSLAIHNFNKADDQLKTYMLDHCSYSETIIRDNESLQRRPVVIINNQTEHRKAQQLIAGWIKAQEHLCAIDPLRFPASSDCFTSKPNLITNVQAVNIYNNTATNSRIVPTQAIIKRLLVAASKHKKAGTIQSIDYKNILNSIEYFTLNANEAFRLRSGGYSEVKLNLIIDDDNVQFKVGERGVFLLPCHAHIDLYTPLQVQSRKKRVSAYDDISTIPYFTGYKGLIYKQSDVIKLDGSF